MKIRNLEPVLKWLRAEKEKNREKSTIPEALFFEIEKIIGKNASFKEDYKKGLININYLYQRILLNKDFARFVPEEFWSEQIWLIEEKMVILNNVAYENQNKEDKVSKKERKEVEYNILQLNYLREELREKLKDSNILLNKLTYLLS